MLHWQAQAKHLRLTSCVVEAASQVHANVLAISQVCTLLVAAWLAMQHAVPAASGGN
jgi:hypothetical protein